MDRRDMADKPLIDMMVLGGATDKNGALIESSIRRAEYASERYYPLCEQLGRRANFLVSGGRAVLAEGVAPEGIEPIAPQMKDIMVEHGVPEDAIVCETTSVSTIENFTNSIKERLLSPGDYSPEHPLLLVTDPTHMARARWMADILGLHTTPESPLYPIPPRERVVQGALTAAYGALTLDLWLKRRRLSEEQTIEQLEGRESLLGSCVGALRKCLPRTKATS